MAFQRDTHLTAIAIAYKNPDTHLIADEVLPRVSVALETFEYTSYSEAEMYTVPDTQVSEYGAVNTTNVGGTTVPAKCEDNGIRIPLSEKDISQAKKNFNPRERATERATNIVQLAHEAKVANLAFNAATYPTSQKVTLDGDPGTEFLNDPEANVLQFLLDSLESCLVRPNRAAIGGDAWAKIRTNPKLVSAVQANSGTQGAISPAQLAELLELSSVHIGRSRINISKPGKTPQLVKAWGNSALFYYVDSTADTSGGLTYGFCAQHGDRVTHTKKVEPGDMGLTGGEIVLVGESTKPLVVAPKAAFLISTATGVIA